VQFPIFNPHHFPQVGNEYVPFNHKVNGEGRHYINLLSGPRQTKYRMFVSRLLELPEKSVRSSPNRSKRQTGEVVFKWPTWKINFEA
jgi:hypothetical protein